MAEPVDPLLKPLDPALTTFIKPVLPEPEVEPEAPSFDVYGPAAMRMENDVYNFFEMMSRERFPPQDDWNEVDYLKKQGLLEQGEMYLGTTSEAEMNWKIAKVALEQKDREILSRAGWPGFVAQVGAGMLSPTTAIPFLRATTGARSIALGAASVLGGAAVQEAVLLANQETRTKGEVAFSLAASTVLGGVLGGIFHTLSKGVVDKIVRDMDAGMVPEAVSKPVPFGTESSVGADVPIGIKDVGKLKPGWGSDTLSRLPIARNPIIRGLQQWNAPSILSEMGGSAEVRKLTAAFSQDDLTLVGNTAGEVASSGGNVEGIRRTYQAVSHAGHLAVQDAFIEYMKAGKGIARLSRAQLSALTDSTKMNYPEFKRQIAIDIWTNFTKPNVAPEVRKAAQEIDRTVFKQLYKEGVETGIFTGEEKVVGDKNYANRIYKNRVIEQRHEEFVGKLAQNYQKNLDREFAEGSARVRERMLKDTQQLDDMKRSTVEVEQVKRELEGESIAIEETTPLEVTAGAATIKDLRREMIEIKRELETLNKSKSANPAAAVARQSRVDELEAQLRQKALEESVTKEALGEDLGKYTKAVQEIRRRLYNLARANDVVDAKRQKVLLKIEQNEDAQIGTILRARQQLDKFVKFLAKGTDAEIERELSKLKNSFEGYAEKFDKVEEQIVKLETGNDVLRDAVSAPQPVTTRVVDEDGEPLVVYHGSPNSDFTTFDKSLINQNDPDALVNGFWFTEDNTEAAQAGAFPAGRENATASQVRAFTLEIKNPATPKQVKAVVAELQANKQDFSQSAVRAELQRRGFDGYHHQSAFRPTKAQYEEFERTGKLDIDKTRWLERAEDGTIDLNDTRVGGYVTGGWTTLKEYVKSNENNVWVAFEPEQIKQVSGTPSFKSADPVLGIPPEQALATKQDVIVTKMNEFAERIDDLDSFDRAGWRAEVDQMMRDLADTSAKINAKRVLRSEKLWKRAEKLSPEAQAKRVAELEARAKARPTKFSESWRGKGADDGDLMTGKADFKDYADELARDITKRILGTDRRLSYSDIIQAERGPELARVLDIPSEEIIDFLEDDIERMIAIYTRTMGADLALMRVFKSLDLAEPLNKMHKEKQEVLKRLSAATKKDGSPRYTPEQLKKQSEQVMKFYDDAQRDLLVMLERTRGVRGIPQDADAWSYRAAKVAMDLNFLRLMGGVIIASVVDPARIIMRHGLTRTMRDGLVPMIKNFKTIRMSQREAILAGTANDVVMHTRMHSMADIFDDAHRGTALERGVHFLTTRMGMMSLIDQWNSGVKQISAGVINARILDSIAMIMGDVKGKPKELLKAQEFLARNNIDAEIAETIWKEVTNGKGGGKVNGVWLPNTEFWNVADPAVARARRAYRAALGNEVDATIITPGLGKPNWTDANTPGRMLAQFKSFGLVSTQKTLMAGLQEHDAAFFNGVMVSLALGAMSYFLWAIAVGGDAEQEMWNSIEEGNWEKWADEAISRSGVTAVFDQVQRVAERLPLFRKYANFSGNPSTRRDSGDLVEATLGPSFDLLEKAYRVIGEVDEPTKSTLHQLRLMMPFQNLFYFRQLLDKVEDAAPLPERRTKER